MRINLAALKENLPSEQPVYLSRFTPGLFRAVEFAFEETKSNQIDWNSFTLEEAEIALEHAMSYEGDDNFDADDEGHPNEGNVIHEYLNNVHAISALKKSKPMMQTAGEVHFF